MGIMMKSEDIRDRIKDIEEFLLKQYKENKEEKKRNWRTYEQQLMNRIKGAIRNLEPLIDEAIDFEVRRENGRKPELELKQKVIILFKVYVIPRKNATLRGSWKWKDIMAEFVHNTHQYLEQYYLRNNSESGFSVDKRWFGWKVEQRREDRIETAITCTNVWHNLLNLYPT